jgi:type IV pilus assembly protein PilQ
MRKQLQTAMIPVLMLVVAGWASDTPSGTSANTKSELQSVKVVRGADDVRVEVSARGSVAPKMSTLDTPARIVMDLPGTVMATGQSHIAVGSDGIKGVRVGTDGRIPPTTRVVVDLEKNMAYELTTSADGKLVLTLHTQNVARANAVKAPVVAKAIATPIPAPTTTVAKAPAAPAATSAPEASKDYVFVEPTYQAKTDSAPAKTEVEPAVRAQEAAERFADKTAAELLPVATLATQDAQKTSAPIEPAVNLAAEQKAQAGQAPAATGPKYTGEPISVNLKDVDLKDFFRLIHEISGLNVVLDPNVQGKLTIVLDDVPWDQALDIVLKNNELARELEGNVLRIATVDTLKREADARHAQVEAEAMAVEKVSVTRFLSYAHAKDAIVTIKKFLSQRGDVVADDRTNAVIVSDIPKVIPTIDRLLTQLDRKTQEVEIEARVVAATRQFARDIGTQLGFGWGNNASTVGGASAVGGSPIGTFGGNPLYSILGTTAPGGSTFAQIPLFSNLGVTSPTSGIGFQTTSNNVRIDAILTMAESRGLLKVLSRPRVVTQNNIQALVKQGVRVPIVTQAQLGGPPTVTYVDAFLRLTVTPQITSENTIFLNVDVENTTPNFGQEVQGNPELITQQATTQVLVTDGGTVVIGGVIQTQNSININQVPLLGNIPFLGNLFKHTQVNTSNQELIFFITPRIIQT